jgi:poly(A) polymerase
VIDWIGGQEDLEQRLIRTIGDARVRVREDPVRILRAVRFATRLRFDIDRELYEAMQDYHAEISRAAPPRVLEEILRILASGVASESFALLDELRVLDILFPDLAHELSDPDAGEATRRFFLRALEALDHLDRGQRSVSNALMLSTLFALPVLKRLDILDSQPQRRDPSLVVDEILRPFARHCRLARRDVSRMKSIFLAQRRFERSGSHNRRGARLADLVRREYFADAFALFRILALARGEGETVAKWEERVAQLPAASPEPAPGRSRRRRHRRRTADSNSDTTPE